MVMSIVLANGFILISMKVTNAKTNKTCQNLQNPPISAADSSFIIRYAPPIWS
ncbi:hypothetical protein V3565_04600 [Bartonella sp. B10]